MAASVNNIPKKKCLVVGLSIVEGLFSFLFYGESGINQYAVQKTLADVFGVSLLLLEFGCRRYVVLPYHIRVLLGFFMFLWEDNSSYITEEEINDIEKLLYLCYLVVLLNMSLIGNKILKGWGNETKYPWAESRIYVYVCVREK